MTPSPPTATASFYARLLAATAAEREEFLAIPLIRAAVGGFVDRTLYLDYLAEAYHHVRHTCPLLCAAASRCGPLDHRYRDALLDYVEEERGHDEWILDDIAALGGDAESVRTGAGGPAVRIMVAYAYHAVERISPYSMLGMVHVLEGMSVALAERAAGAISRALAADPARGFSYLRSHGALDREHVDFFERLVDGIDDADARDAVVDTARIMYRLFGDVFRDLEARRAGVSVHAA